MPDVVVDRIDPGGDGFAGPVRVPGGLPGEVWRGEVNENELRGGVAVANSPDRTDPPCPHYQACGGCSVQHLSDAAIADWKRRIVVQALEGRGLTAQVLPTLTSPSRSRRRVVLTGRRTRKTVLVGLHARRSDTVEDIRECLVMRPEILAARAAFGHLTRLGASRSGEVKITATQGPAGLDIGVTEAKPADRAMATDLAAIAQEADFARLTWNGDTVAQRRRPYSEFAGGARVALPPGGFLQATGHGEKTLVDFTLETLGEAGRVADLFCGAGTFSLPAARRAEVLAVDGAPEMVAALDAAWRMTPGLKRIVARARDLFRRPVLASEFRGFQAAVIDPPRAGAEAQTRELAGSDIARIAAVSCNPLTFARDAQILTGAGFSLDLVQPVDQFLWSGHVELAARFSR